MFDTAGGWSFGVVRVTLVGAHLLILATFVVDGDTDSTPLKRGWYYYYSLHFSESVPLLGADEHLTGLL